MTITNLLVALLLTAPLLGAELHDPSFWQLMKKDGSAEHQQPGKGGGWTLFETLFTRYQQQKKPSLLEARVRIPHTIHFIWLGTPMPEFSRKMVESWKRFHPDWEVKIWTDKDLDTFGLKNRAAYDKSINWGEKSDIFRYEILYRYGGVYADAADFECLRSFDELHTTCDFYAGIAYGRRPIVYNGLIGCTPRHPIMKQCIKSIRVGKSDHSRWRIVCATGPYFLTKCMKKCLANDRLKQRQGVVVAFPTILFYPFPDALHTTYSSIEEVKKRFVCPEAFAIHYWKSSWDPN